MTRHGDQPQPVWPAGEHDPLTPLGRIEQIGQLGSGLRRNPRGVRRAGRMLAWLAAALAAGTVAAVLAVTLT